jgi:hypothetical protein
MHDGTKNLNIRDIFNAPAIFNDDNGIGIRIFIYLIFETIKKIYRFAVNTIFNNLLTKTETASTIFIIPEMNRIAIYKIKFWQFGIINENERIIAGIYNIYDNIFLNQLNLKASEKLFPDNSNDNFRNRL